MTQAANVYQSVTDIEHVLLRPDMYINALERIPRIAKCLNSSEMKIVQKIVTLPEGQEQVFVEILGNAADNVWESREKGIDAGHIEVTVNSEWFIVKNYGLAIPVQQNEIGMWIPQSIFGNLRSSSKYDDSKKRYLIGKNGLGGKLTNIYSRCFAIECADPQRGILYKQHWQNNMKIVSEPETSPYSGPGYTQVSVSLDFARFGTTGYDMEALEVYAGHCAAVSYTCAVPVMFNGQKFEIKDLFSYAGLFYPVNRASAITYKDPEGTYDLCIIDTPDTGEQGKMCAVNASFVNGIVTSNGGVHVDAAYKVIVQSIIDFMGKTAEGISITKRDIVNHVSLFISCRINNPKFTSQIKDNLKSPTPKIELPENLLKGIRKWRLIQTIIEEIERKQKNKMKKTDGKRKKRPRTDDSSPANLAGTSRSMETTFILTEGKSADSYRLKFISQVPNGMGREFFGSLPLHGKILNVLNAEFLQIYEHKDLVAIRQNLGLKSDVDYSLDENYRKLNYGSLLIMPDPDNDGKHIMGLVLLFFLRYYPGLVQRGFIKFLRIPVVRIIVNGQQLSFYSMSSFKSYMSRLHPNSQTSIPDYFKGLGSSEDHHIKQDFANPKIVTFRVCERTAEKISLAFLKTSSNLRKEWIANWVNQINIDTDNYTDLPISTFIDYEFIDYSIENIIRGVPEAYDGLKESQRKALYAAMRKLKGKNSKIKVAQVASHAAEITNYKHGEGCLADTIVQMTYNFVGSNNMPYFYPKGQFGTRQNGGADSANPRYTSIALPWWIPVVFRPEDKRLEKLIVDEGEEQECENLFPIIPMHLINGVVGIGTAYSSNIPNHNPLDLALYLQQRLLQDLQPESNHQLPLIRPYYKGFKGQIIPIENGFMTEGIMTINYDQSITITELPIGSWTEAYEKELAKWEEEGIISSFDIYCTDEDIKIIIHKYNDGTPTLKKLKLYSKHSYKNMTVLYRTPNRGILPKIYKNLNELIEDFYKIRLEKYVERKALMLLEFDRDINLLSERARYIHAVAVEQSLEIRNRSEVELFAQMDQMGFARDLLDKVKNRSLTKEQIPLLYKKIQDKQEEKARLEIITPQATWYNELEEFIVKFCKEEKCTRSTLESCNPIMTLNIEDMTPKSNSK